jgi:hypothetical protein
MADTTSTVALPAVTEDSLIAERQRFWGGFTTATFAAAVFVAVVLVLMAIFLL